MLISVFMENVSRVFVTSFTGNIAMRKPAIFQSFAKVPFWVVVVLTAALSLFLAWQLTAGEIGVVFFVLAWLIMIAIGAVLQPRKTIESLRSTGKGGAFGVYLVISLFSLLLLGGQIHRRELPLWVWSACSQALQHSGLGDAVFTFCLYTLLYSPPFVIPYVLLSWTDAVDNPAVNVFASIWCGFTFFLFLDSVSGAIGAFVRRLPSDVWNGWLLVPWLLFTVLAAAAWWAARKETKEKRRTQEMCDGEQPRW